MPGKALNAYESQESLDLLIYVVSAFKRMATGLLLMRCILAGDLLRQERERPGSRYGQLIEEYIKEGKIVPSEITVGLLESEMESSGSRRFLIDGFPRKLDQAIMFDELVCQA